MNVYLASVQATVARALTIAPADRSRIEKAATLISFGHVEQTDASTFSVRSLTDSTLIYTVQPDACTCEGRRHYLTRRCSHEWACRIVLSAEREDAAQREQTQRARFTADSMAVAYASARRAA